MASSRARSKRGWLSVWLQARRRKRAAGQSQAGPAVPAAPANLDAVDMFTFVRLAWTDMASDEWGFRVYRDGTWIVELGPDATGYDDTTVAAGTHEYYVVAYNVYGESAHSNHVGISFLA